MIPADGKPNQVEWLDKLELRLKSVQLELDWDCIKYRLRYGQKKTIPVGSAGSAGSGGWIIWK